MTFSDGRVMQDDASAVLSEMCKRNISLALACDGDGLQSMAISRDEVAVRMTIIFR